MTGFDADRARQVLAHIRTLPTSGDGDVWNQAGWMAPTECGTTACFAGWTVLLAARAGQVENPASWNVASTASGLLGLGACFFGSGPVWELFDGDRTLDDIEAAIEHLAALDAAGTLPRVGLPAPYEHCSVCGNRRPAGRWAWPDGTERVLCDEHAPAAPDYLPPAASSEAAS